MLCAILYSNVAVQWPLLVLLVLPLICNAQAGGKRLKGESAQVKAFVSCAGGKHTWAALSGGRSVERTSKSCAVQANVHAAAFYSDSNSNNLAFEFRTLLHEFFSMRRKIFFLTENERSTAHQLISATTTTTLLLANGHCFCVCCFCHEKKTCAALISHHITSLNGSYVPNNYPANKIKT